MISCRSKENNKHLCLSAILIKGKTRMNGGIIERRCNIDAQNNDIGNSEIIRKKKGLKPGILK
jgi:hypothetical protein